MKTICIVDDQHVVLQALSSIFNESEKVSLIGSFLSAEEFVNEYSQLRPDVTIMDLDLPGISGTEAILIVKSRYPQAKFIVLTNYDDNDRLFNALKAGADGYLLKRNSLENISSSVETLFEGGAPMSHEIARRVITYFNRPDEIAKFNMLTEREAAVLQLLAEGLLYKEIAGKLGVGLDTIKKHTQNIYEKLQIHTRSEAVKMYLKS